MLGLRFFAWASPDCNDQGLLFHLGEWASHCAGFSYYRAQAAGTPASAVAARGLCSCGTSVQLLRGM